MKMTSLRELPAVEQLLQTARVAGLAAAFGRPLTLDALRLSLDEARAAIQAGADSAPGRDALIARAESLLAAWTRPTLQSVINATA
jgi:L-seryl-tRNA(Ser) seleniumtransferase